MKKISLYLLLLLTTCVVYGQNFPYPFRYNTKVIVNSQYVDTWFGLNDAKIYTNKDTFRFNKPIDLTRGGFTVNGKAISADSAIYSTHYYTNRQIAAATTGLVDYRGTYNASSGVFPSTGGSGTAGAILKGDYWSISVEGTIGGVLYTVGSSLLAMVDNPGQTATNWDKQVVSAPLAVRTFEDINSGVPAYSGTTLKDGQFFGSDLTATGTKVGGFNGYFNVNRLNANTLSNFYQGLNLSSSSSTLPTLNITNNNNKGILISQGSGGTGIPFAISIGGAVNHYTVNPNASASTTPYINDTYANHTSGNLFEGKNFGTVKYSFDYNGKLTANGVVCYTDATTGVTGYSQTLNGGYFGTTSGRALRLTISAGSISDMIECDSSGNVKLKIDYQGDIHNNPPHASSWFADSSRLITLTQNTWAGITNTWKKLYPSTGDNYYFNKITKTGDSCKITKAGRYEIIYELNATGTANATYEYRLCKRSGSTITYYNKQVLVGTGATVVRIVSGSLALIANDVVWSEVRTTTAGNNSITVIGGQIRIKTIKLDL